MIWIVYKGDIPKNKILNHKDGEKSNASLNNLELVTPKENSKHAVVTGLNNPVIGEDQPLAIFTNKQVKSYRKLYYKGLITVKDLTVKHGCHRVTVHAMLKGITYSAV